jgi:tungstate transport system ATP-binding protein
MMLFQVNGLTKTYGQRTVLDLPSLGLEKGLIYSLQGPNGSGKTTLLEILSFLALPTSGEILYEGRKVDPGRNSLTALRREIVMVPQNPILFTTTVYRNIELGLRIRGISGEERERAVHECLDLVGMREFLNAPAHKLSGGETQRIAIARALACSPKVIFFDEPTSNVDATSQKAIERIMRDINTRKNISLVFTTHDPGQASRLSHRVITLFEGRPVNSAFGNIFKGHVSIDERGRGLCLVEDKVHLVVEAQRSGDVNLSLDPTKIKVLGRDDPGTLQNRLRGVVVRLADEGTQILLTLDVGVPLNILLPNDGTPQPPLTLRQEVEVYCPPEAIQVF